MKKFANTMLKRLLKYIKVRALGLNDKVLDKL